MNRGAQYGNKYRWLHDERFLKDLEGDSVDSEILEDELRSLQYDGPATCRTRLGKVLESNPLQVVLCVLVLIDAGIVVAEMLLDLHSIRGEMRETQEDVNRLLKFMRIDHYRELRDYQGTNITEILSRIKTFTPKTSNDSSGVNSDTGEAYLTGDAYDREFEQTAELFAAQDQERFRRSAGTGNTNSGASGGRTTSGTGEELTLSPAPNHKNNNNNNNNDSVKLKNSLDVSSDSSLETRLPSQLQRNQPTEDLNSPDDMPYPAQERRLSRDHKVLVTDDQPATGARSTRAVEDSHTPVNARNNCVCFFGNESFDENHNNHHGKTQSQLLHEIAHALHFCSIGILGIFVLQVLLRVVALDLEFFRRKMEIFDAIIIIASFAMDLIFLGGIGGAGEEAAALIILFLLWRILRVVNGILVTAKQRQEFRMKLQKRARRRAERKIEMLQDDKHMKEKEISALKELCMLNGASVEDVRSCKPRRVLKRLDTSSGLTSVASLSLSLSMSMSTGIFGNIVSATRRENSPFAKHKSRSANRKGRDGSLTPRSAQGSMEDLKSRSSENLLTVKPRDNFTTIRELNANKEEGVLEPLVGGASAAPESGDENAKVPDEYEQKPIKGGPSSAPVKPTPPICDIIVTIDDTGTSVKNDVRPQTPKKCGTVVSMAEPLPGRGIQVPTKSQSADNTPKHSQPIPPHSQSAGSTPKRNPRTVINRPSPPEITISDCTAVSADKSGAALHPTKPIPSKLSNGSSESQIEGKQESATAKSPVGSAKLNSKPKTEVVTGKPDIDNKESVNDSISSMQGKSPVTPGDFSTSDNDKQSLAHDVASKLSSTPLKPQSSKESAKATTVQPLHFLPLKPVVSLPKPTQNHVASGLENTQLESQPDKMNESSIADKQAALNMSQDPKKLELKEISQKDKPRELDFSNIAKLPSPSPPPKVRHAVKVDNIPKLPNCQKSNRTVLNENVGDCAKGKLKTPDRDDKAPPTQKSAIVRPKHDSPSPKRVRSPHLNVRFKNEVEENIIATDEPVSKNLLKKNNTNEAPSNEVVVNCDGV